MDDREHLEAVARMQAHIEANLLEPITLKALSRAAGYSPYHSARLFRALTGRTPFEYIRAARLSKAALRLRDGGEAVLTVALDFVFDSHEGFTRAFSRQFGITPKRYAKSPPPIPLFLPSPVTGRSAIERRRSEPMEVDEQFIFTQVIERPQRKLLIKRGRAAADYFEYCEEVGCDVWGVLLSVREALYEPIGMWLPDRFRPEGTSKYAQGVELPADYGGAVPEGYELIDLPPCKLMVFQGPPFDDDKFCEAIDALEAAVDRFDPSLYGYRWADEDAPRFQLEPQGYRGYIAARPVKQAT
ncbi:MAG: helix-turn-helix transcriptional regulator [Clostridiales bacterium]|jgi:AraC family transcriptional regulator|nr:helix-turn-helix transcriptional regulator [Clostridiales bacterium]